MSWQGATWWTGDKATTITFDITSRVDGCVWIDGGKRLRAGLGTIDLANKSFAVEPALQPFVKDVKRIGALAWFPDGTRVAMVINPPELRVDQKPPRDFDRSKRELVIASIAGAEPAIRRPVTVIGTAGIAASDDRLLLGGRATQIFDTRGEPVPVSLKGLPAGVARASFNAGRFVAVGLDGTIALLDAKSGATNATWGGAGIRDAVAAGNTIVSVEATAMVHVGCLAGGKITEVATASAGTIADLVQIVGDRVVVSADEPNPIRVATLTSPCAP